VGLPTKFRIQGDAEISDIWSERNGVFVLSDDVMVGVSSPGKNDRLAFFRGNFK